MVCFYKQKINSFRSKWSSKDSYGNILKNSIDYLYSQTDSDVYKLLEKETVLIHINLF